VAGDHFPVLAPLRSLLRGQLAAGTHGSMTERDWRRVIDQAADLGVEMVQFIGGEPTMNPVLPALIDHALNCALAVEVFSHLAYVTPALWDVFSRPDVSLATSYYSDDPTQHEAITQRRGSYADTKANIAEAVRRGIPLRAGVIDLGGGQRAEQARAQLVDLGVSSVGYDRLRQVGRGVRDERASVEQLCGRCGDAVAAVSPDGTVWPCVVPAGCRSGTSWTPNSPPSSPAHRPAGCVRNLPRRSPRVLGRRRPSASPTRAIRTATRPASRAVFPGVARPVTRSRASRTPVGRSIAAGEPRVA
jgi:hypothetical protein